MELRTSSFVESMLSGQNFSIVDFKRAISMKGSKLTPSHGFLKNEDVIRMNRAHFDYDKQS